MKTFMKKFRLALLMASALWGAAGCKTPAAAPSRPRENPPPPPLREERGAERPTDRSRSKRNDRPFGEKSNSETSAKGGKQTPTAANRTDAQKTDGGKPTPAAAKPDDAQRQTPAAAKPDEGKQTPTPAHKTAADGTQKQPAAEEKSAEEKPVPIRNRSRAKRSRTGTARSRRHDLNTPPQPKRKVVFRTAPPSAEPATAAKKPAPPPRDSATTATTAPPPDGDRGGDADDVKYSPGRSGKWERPAEPEHQAVWDMAILRIRRMIASRSVTFSPLGAPGTSLIRRGDSLWHLTGAVVVDSVEYTIECDVYANAQDCHISKFSSTPADGR